MCDHRLSHHWSAVGRCLGAKNTPIVDFHLTILRAAIAGIGLGLWVDLQHLRSKACCLLIFSSYLLHAASGWQAYQIWRRCYIQKSCISLHCDVSQVRPSRFLFLSLNPHAFFLQLLGSQSSSTTRYWHLRKRLNTFGHPSSSTRKDNLAAGGLSQKFFTCARALQLP